MQAGYVLRQRYKILQQLSSGGFGVTYLAEDQDRPNQPKCVVKHLQVDFSNYTSSTPEQKAATLQVARRLFEAEAATLDKLGQNHQQIPTLFAHFVENDEFYLVQDFVEGYTLDQEIGGGIRHSESQVRSLLIEILEVLAFVHEQGVIHRDLKPANIMRRTSDQKIVLIDFGAVKQIKGTLTVNPQGQASSTISIGTPGYTAPEQAAGQPLYASDVYAVGAMAIQALTGMHPNQLGVTSDLEIAWRSQVQVSPRFGAILQRMICYHFRDRYGTAGDVLTALRGLSQPVAQSVTRPVVRQKATSLVNPTVTNRSRGDFLKWLGWGSAGFMGVLLFNRGFTKSEPSGLKPEVPAVNPPTSSPSTPMPKPTPTPKPMPSFRNFTISLPNKQSMPMIAVQGGTFMIGSPKGVGSDNEQPQTQITLSDFYMSQYEVTNAQWFALMGDYEEDKSYGLKLSELYAATDSNLKGDNQPISMLTWNYARAYCRRLSQITGQQCRLPTEAEWEYAAKGGTQTRGYTYAGSNNLDEVGWYDENSGNVTHSVGQKKPNELGLYDMSGNAWEWCEDTYHKTYEGIPQDGSAWNTGGEKDTRVLRGGGFLVNASSCRLTYRLSGDTPIRGPEHSLGGFRVVISFSMLNMVDPVRNSAR
jgi:formylglycine-generating enzyme required for sulfatase activity